MEKLIVVHKEKGEGVVVDRIFDFKDGNYTVLLGVAYFDHDRPAVQYENPDDLDCIDFIDTFAELEDDEEGEEGGEETE